MTILRPKIAQILLLCLLSPAAVYGNSHLVPCLESHLIAETLFEPAQGNSSIDHAEVVLIGNTHSNESHIEHAQSLINALARPGDIVLLEGVQLGKIVDPSTYPFLEDVRQHVIGMGWDDLPLRRQAEQNVRKLIELHKKINQETSPSEKTSLEKQFARLAAKNETIAIPKRNESLIRALKTILARKQPGQRIFVLGGSNHFQEAKLLKYLHTSDFAVLIPKEHDAPTFENVDAYYNNSGTTSH